MRSPHWTTRLELALGEPTALRVLDKRSIVGLATDVQSDISEPAVERWIQEAISAGRSATRGTRTLSQSPRWTTCAAL